MDIDHTWSLLPRLDLLQAMMIASDMNMDGLTELLRSVDNMVETTSNLWAHILAFVGSHPTVKEVELMGEKTIPLELLRRIITAFNRAETDLKRVGYVVHVLSDVKQPDLLVKALSISAKIFSDPDLDLPVPAWMTADFDFGEPVEMSMSQVRELVQKTGLWDLFQFWRSRCSEEAISEEAIEENVAKLFLELDDSIEDIRMKICVLLVFFNGYQDG